VPIVIYGRAEQRVPTTSWMALSGTPSALSRFTAVWRETFTTRRSSPALPSRPCQMRSTLRGSGRVPTMETNTSSVVGLASSGSRAVLLLRVLPCHTVEALALSAGQREPTLPASIRAQTAIAVTCTALPASRFRRCDS
jgi:hypothetical protein